MIDMIDMILYYLSILITNTNTNTNTNTYTNNITFFNNKWY